MKLVSFDIFRTLGFPNTTVIKAEHIARHKTLLQEADWVLYPEYWQLNGLLYGLKCRIFPSEASYRIGHDKIEMTRAFELIAPANTPLTLIHGNTPEYRDLIWDTLPAPFVAKLPRASMGEGVWLIETREDWQRYCDRTPTLYAQEYLPIDRDVRVVVVGDKVVTAYWRLQSAQGFYNNVAKGGTVDLSPVPEAALTLALSLAHALEVDHAGFDIAMVGGHPYVLEFNRLFGNQGLGKGSELRDAILEYLIKRSKPEGPERPAPVLPVAV